MHSPTAFLISLKGLKKVLQVKLRECGNDLNYCVNRKEPFLVDIQRIFIS